MKSNNRHLFQAMTFQQTACLLLVILMVASLFYLGGKPVSVGLFHPPMDKVAHFGTFGLITILLCLALPRANLMLLIGIAALIGGADEIHQLFVPGRSAGWDDFGADLIAAVTAASLMFYARLYRELQTQSAVD